MRLAFQEVSYSYDGRKSAVNGVSFAVESATIVCVAGPTGSGKSTLLSLAAGLIAPDQGSVLLDDTPVTYDKAGRCAELRMKTGLQYQYSETQLFASSVAEDVAFGPRNEGISDAEVQARVRVALEAVGLDPALFGPRSPFKLSSGQQKRVALAGMLTCKPNLLILDEPMAGLDPQNRREFRQLLKHLRDEGRSILMASHSMDDVADLAQQVVVLKDGSAVLQGSPDRVFSDVGTLKAMGLTAPHAQRLATKLANRGIPLPEAYYDEDGLSAALVSQLR